MAAFDWSPGGCCCGPKTSWFDFYWSRFPTTTPFQRQAAMLPVGNGYPYGSQLAVGWIITPQLQPPDTSFGITRDGKKVWALETKFNDTLPCNYLAHYDAVNKTQQFLLDAFTIRNTTQPAFLAPGPISDTRYLDRANGEWNLVDDTGAIERWGVVTSKVTTRQITGFTEKTEEQVILPAMLDFPHWAAETRVTKSNFQISNIPVRTDLFIGQSEKPAQGETWLQITGRQSVRSYNATDARWVSFDRFNNWAGVTWFDGGTLGSRTELIYGGTSVWLRETPPYIDDDFHFKYIPGGTDFSVHVCYPHESLGAGYLASAETTWPARTSFGYLSQKTRECYLVLYKDGAEVWRTPKMFTPPTIYGSTDRWIYFSTEPVNVETFTGGKYKGTQSPYTGRFWIVKHDGSELIPVGALQNTFGEIRQADLMPTPVDLGANIFVRDSSAVPYCLPATYQEMYDGRND